MDKWNFCPCVLCIKSFPAPILLQDLPPLEELTITVDENVEMMCVGKIASIVDELGKLDQIKKYLFLR